MEWWQRDRAGVLDQTLHLPNQTRGAHSTPTRIPTKEITAPADGYQLRYLMWWDELEVSGVRWLMNLGWCHPATGDLGADCLSNQGAPGRCWEAQLTSLTHKHISASLKRILSNQAGIKVLKLKIKEKKSNAYDKYDKYESMIYDLYFWYKYKFWALIHIAICTQLFRIPFLKKICSNIFWFLQNLQVQQIHYNNGICIIIHVNTFHLFKMTLL